LTHGNLAAAAGDAIRLSKALARQDMRSAVAILNELLKKLESAVAVEAVLERKGQIE
jgi:hypothetical protein